MIKRTFAARVLISAGLFLLLTLASAFGQKGKPTRQTDVALAVDFGSGGAIVGDGKGIYTDGSSNMRVEITYGNLYFDTNEMKGDGGRRVFIGFICSGTIGDIPCPTPGLQDVYVATRDDLVPQFDLAGMTLYESFDKRCAITWAEGDYTYHLRWNYPDAPHGNVRFTCTTADVNGVCTQWEANPTGLVGLYGKATRAKDPEAYITTADLPFQMILTRQP